jgi:hypothetical protein
MRVRKNAYPTVYERLGLLCIREGQSLVSRR